MHDGQAEARALARTSCGTAERCRRDPPAAMPQPSSSTVSVSSSLPASLLGRCRQQRSRPPCGIARRPLVARFQTICRIWFSSASNQTGSAGTSTSIDVVARRPRRCCAAAVAVSCTTRRTSSRATANRCGPRVGQERLDRVVQPLRLPQHDVHQLRLLVAERQLLPQHLHRARHRRQRVADLVRDARRHLADRREPLLQPRARARGRLMSVTSWNVNRYPRRPSGSGSVRDGQADVDQPCRRRSVLLVGPHAAACRQVVSSRAAKLRRQLQHVRRRRGRSPAPAVRPVIAAAARLNVSTRPSASAVTRPLSRLSMTYWLNARRSAICVRRVVRGCAPRRSQALGERAGQQRHGEEPEQVDGHRVLREAPRRQLREAERLPRRREERGRLEVLRRRRAPDTGWR